MLIRKDIQQTLSECSVFSILSEFSRFQLIVREQSSILNIIQQRMRKRKMFSGYLQQLQNPNTLLHQLQQSLVLREKSSQFYLHFKKTSRLDTLSIAFQYLNHQPVVLNDYVFINLQNKIASSKLKRLKLVTHRNRIQFIAKNPCNQNRQKTLGIWIKAVLRELESISDLLAQILAYNGEIGRKFSREMTLKSSFKDCQKMLEAKLQLQRNIADINTHQGDSQQRKLVSEYQQKSTINPGKSNLFIIEQIKQKKGGSTEHKTGGVCTIQRCSIDKIKFHALAQADSNSQLSGITLAKKQIRKNEVPPSIKDSSDLRDKMRQKQLELENRFYHEIDILKHISKNGRKQYLLDYYLFEKDRQTYYVEFVEMNLNEFLYFYGENLGHREILDICQQVVSIVIDLHRCGVIHRDLKPTNFMVKYDQEKGTIDVKLIDFSDSYVKDLNKDISIYSTIPYSPLQCSKNNKRFKEFGLDKQPIDYWSIGILLSEIVFGIMPVSYSSVFSKDIHMLWEQDFLHSPISSARQNGYKIIHNAIKRLNQSLIDPNPIKRLSHKKAMLFLSYIRKYYQKITSDNIGDVRLSTSKQGTDSKSNRFGYHLDNDIIQTNGTVIQ